MTVQFVMGCASAEQIIAHLQGCDGNFVPSLSGRVNIAEYGSKIANHAQCFEAWADGELAGLVAAYCNAADGQVVYVTSVSVLPAWQGRGIASHLLECCVDYVRGLGFACIELEVGEGNGAAIALYKKHGFSPGAGQGGVVRMSLDLRKAI